MSHDDEPVDDGFGGVPLLGSSKMEVFKVSVIEKECFGLVESNGASVVIIEDV